jgi:hypothetical protein
MYFLMYHYQNAGINRMSYENMAKFKYLGTTVTISNPYMLNSGAD